MCLKYPRPLIIHSPEGKEKLAGKGCEKKWWEMIFLFQLLRKTNINRRSPLPFCPTGNNCCRSVSLSFSTHNKKSQRYLCNFFHLYASRQLRQKFCFIKNCFQVLPITWHHLLPATSDWRHGWCKSSWKEAIFINFLWFSPQTCL